MVECKYIVSQGGFAMKKHSLFIIVLALSALTGCGYKVPTTDFNKVKTAFNGVEKSFKKIASAKKAPTLNNRGLLPKRKNVDDGLTSIFNLFASDDIRGHSVEDLSYNEPPMVQFQYLKAVFDKVGSGFEFGTKYYDNITGEMYVDFETGFKAEKKDEYKYAFDYELAIDVNIDSNDLINADVTFDITLSKNGQNYNSKWYVNLLLDYDMNNSSPTYTLTMLTENDETDLPYFNRFTYEYDYVDVKSNKINEWRKFCMHSSERLVKDDTHPSFESYVNQGITYKVDYPKWFKNGDYYKLTQMPESRQKSVGNAMYDGLGLNANDINADPFFAKQGTRNGVMQTVYKDFSKIYGDEIIYDLICRDEDDYNDNNQAQPTGIKAMFKDGVTGADNISVDNIHIIDLFNGFTDPFGERNQGIDLWYCDENFNGLYKVDDLNRLSYQFTTKVYDSDSWTSGSADHVPVDITLDMRILEAYAMLKNRNNFTNYSRSISILVTDSNNIQGKFTLTYNGDFPDDYVAPTFPQELKALGIPEYEGQHLAFDFSRNGELYTLKITGSDGGELDKYLEKVSKAGFARDWYNPNYLLYAPIFKKSFSEQENLFLQVDSTQKDCYLLKAWKEQIPNDDGNNGEGNGDDGGGEETPLSISSLCLYGSFNNWGQGDANNYIFTQINENSFRIEQVVVQPGDKFKVVADGDWAIHNSDTAYGGFGYDDFDNISEFSYYFQKEEGPDSNIIVKQNCELTIEAQNSGTHLGLRIVNVKQTGPKQ